ncbi:hypothetical protein CEV31_1897 [Brucella thiophenivorans]|uniref:Uncharacterized protein n=1 Tax=Brucella thiophenivorans TaxID=571255 RepID=A0A256FWU0_9HYPH|nr:hypothetical protein CEV31_1897 [Brucella thiophenivorans]
MGGFFYYYPMPALLLLAIIETRATNICLLTIDRQSKPIL